MTPRLLHAPLATGRITLGEDALHHLRRVLRCAPGDPVVLFDGQGQEGRAVVVEFSRNAVLIEVGPVTRIERESPGHITVLQALCSGDKMDWVVEKATELGAHTIVPVACSRSVLKLEGERAQKRVAHWRRIAEAASAQSGRNRVPQIADVCGLHEALLDFAQGPQPKTGWMLDPFAARKLSDAPLEGPITFLIGPEAGLADDEEALARAQGLVAVQCGPRILRTETAALVVLSAIAARLGEL